jgi:hypothetical protein
MMKYTTTIALLLLSLCSAQASIYKVDMTAVDRSFVNAEDITAHVGLMFNADQTISTAAFEMMLADEADGGKSQTTAAIIALATVIAPSLITAVTGGFGAPVFILTMIPWHRIYLGTGGKTGKVIALYCVTLDWCGWLTLVDGVMLLIDDTDSKYIDNPKYVMWIGEF